MKIRLNNIGIIHDSSINLDGLTVITGKNNSGKTTVGKALYSLLDAVSNLSAKAKSNREQYIIRQLDGIIESMDLFRFFLRAHDFDEKNEFPFFNYQAIVSLFLEDYKRDMPRSEVEVFARKLQIEFSTINVEALSKIVPLKYYAHHLSRKRDGDVDLVKMISAQIENALRILEELFCSLEKDPQLIDFTRESINQTLNVEFAGQIQPASIEVERSKIEIYENDTCCFNVSIRNNRIVNEGTPVFFSSPYKKAFFVDNPFLFGALPTPRRFSRSLISSETESLLNPNSILSHNDRLGFILRGNDKPTVLEQTIIDDSIEKIKREIDKIIPGTFEFSSNGDYYVQNGKKLKMTNLATGSKMFSIMKLLLEKGHLGKSTMLILDEPEAHLHPSWQNCFAEMIVLLVKKLDVNVVLTTHSSNFVLALDAYMRKYAIEDKTNFYRTDFNAEGMVDYVCANDKIETIYQDFLQYLSEVKMLRNECLKNVGEES